MSTAKFTQGPWSASVQPDGTNFTLRSGDVQIVGGCGCCGSPFMNGEDPLADASRIAQCVNAHDDLIAALNGFIAIDKSFQTICDEHLDELCEKNALARAVRAARAAIAKATRSAA